MKLLYYLFYTVVSFQFKTLKCLHDYMHHILIVEPTIKKKSKKRALRVYTRRIQLYKI